jgi:hypothetical protein
MRRRGPRADLFAGARRCAAWSPEPVSSAPAHRGPAVLAATCGRSLAEAVLRGDCLDRRCVVGHVASSGDPMGASFGEEPGLNHGYKRAFPQPGSTRYRSDARFALLGVSPGQALERHYLRLPGPGRESTSRGRLASTTQDPDPAPRRRGQLGHTRLGRRVRDELALRPPVASRGQRSSGG